MPRGKPGPVEYVIAGAQDVLSVAARFGGAGNLLSGTELAMAARFKHPADGQGYAAAHVLFRVLAARALGTDPLNARDLPVRRQCHTCGGPHGKPVIDGSNLSLSRARDVVMVASGSPGQPLGADLEAVPRQLHPGFDSYALSPAERRTLTPADVGSRIRLWVAKEAALKASGHGLAIAPGTLHVGSPAPGQQGTTAAGWAAAVVSPALAQVHGLNIAWVPAATRHAAALATLGQPNIAALDLQEAFCFS